MSSTIICCTPLARNSDMAHLIPVSYNSFCQTKKVVFITRSREVHSNTKLYNFIENYDYLTFCHIHGRSRTDYKVTVRALKFSTNIKNARLIPLLVTDIQVCRLPHASMHMGLTCKSNTEQDVKYAHKYLENSNA